MIAWLRTSLFFLGWVGFTLLVGLGCLPALARQHWSWYVARYWVTGTLLWLHLACGIRSEVRGREHLPRDGGLIACKHESAWDTLVLWHVLGHPAFVLKRELYHIPVFGWYLRRTGQIAIDRSAGKAAVRGMLETAQRIVAQGRTVIIFPEGTRVRPQIEIPFHAGVARLSAQLQSPVTPAALNSGLFWPKYTLKKSPGTAIIEFLPALPVCSEPLAAWLDGLQRTVNGRSAELAAAAMQLPLA